MRNVIKTGFEELDNYFGNEGLGDNSLSLVVSRPGMGKSTFALHIVNNNNINDKSIAVFNYECNEEYNIKRLKDLFNTDVDGKRLHFCADKDDLVGDIINKCIELKESEDGLDLVIVDYMQLINSVVGRNDYNADILNNLKKFIAEYNVPVIVLWQLGRYEDSYKQAPKLENINLDSEIMNSLDNIIYLFKADNMEKENVEIGVLKSKQNESIKMEVQLWNKLNS